MSEVKPQISIEEFSKVDLRVATVIKAEAVPRAKKLIKLDIDVGEQRTIVAGIAGSYKPEELVGKQIVVVANLKPAKIMGILSNGMLLAAVGEKGTSIITPSRKMAPGTRLQ
jgi:methionyl-tRNA synthetase